MEVNKRSSSSSSNNSGTTQSIISDDEMDLRRGPWTIEEDFALINYITSHGEGRWNSLARCAGLKRTGKSCRLRWLNYLRPDVRRGNITLEEQLMILELHSRWGNRWSKIAQYLPGRTDNEIKNYWRTRVQKHAKQLKCDVNSKQFKDTMRYLWMPRLVERIQAASASANVDNLTASITTADCSDLSHQSINDLATSNNTIIHTQVNSNSNITSENSANSSDSLGTQVSDLTDYYGFPINNNNNNDNNNNNYDYNYNNNNNNNNNNNQIVNQDYFQGDYMGYGADQSLTSPNYYFNNQGLDFQEANNMATPQNWYTDNLWSVEDNYFLQ
ncbi:hypothetical protein KSS87_020509 [Heliosperma pusillum]|nr:hypothetical protein KSS87_020509 [Heliosperma pusillum]